MRGGDLGEALGGEFGDGFGEDVGLEGVWVVPDGLEDGEVVGEVEVVEGEDVAFGFGAGEVGGDDDAVEVAGDEEGRVLEVVFVADRLPNVLTPSVRVSGHRRRVHRIDLYRPSGRHLGRVKD